MKYLPNKECMKYRFKQKRIYYPWLAEQVVWKDMASERGFTKNVKKAYNAKAHKPLWRKKRKEQKRAKWEEKELWECIRAFDSEGM